MNQKEISEEVHSIRQQVWNLSDRIPMIKAQWDAFQIVKSRLWDVAEKIKIVNTTDGVTITQQEYEELKNYKFMYEGLCK